MRRLGCLLTLVVCLAFWSLVAFVAINVIAASREAQDPGSAAGLIGPGLRGTPHVVRDGGSATPRKSGPFGHPGGVPLPAAVNVTASEGPSGLTSSMPAITRTEALGELVEAETTEVLR